MIAEPVDLSRAHRVLIIKLSAMGDIIHALPVSAAIGAAFPNVKISWVVEEMFVPLLDGNPFLDEVIPLPKVRGRQIRSRAMQRRYMEALAGIRHRRFDVAIDLQGLTKSAVLAVASGAPVRLGYHWLRELAPYMVRPVPAESSSTHIVDQYLDVARYLGARPEMVKFPLPVSAEADAAVQSMLVGAGIADGTRFVAVNPAAGHPLKQWGERNFAAVVDAIHRDLGLTPVLVTADRPVADRIAEYAEAPCVNLAGRTDLRQLAALLNRCAAHVCGDTGSGHMAAALGRPVVALIGPTDPDRACPYGQRDNVVSRRDLCDTRCRPHHCAFHQPHCLSSISVQDVVRKLHALTA